MIDDKLSRIEIVGSKKSGKIFARRRAPNLW